MFFSYRSVFTEYQLKGNEAMHITWIQPKLYKPVEDYTLSLIVQA